MLLALALSLFARTQLGAPELATVGSLRNPVVSPDGTRLVAGSVDRAWLLDARDGTPLLALDGAGRGGPWSGARFSSDGARCVLWSERGWVARIDATAAALLWYLPLGASAEGVRARVDERCDRIAQHLRTALRLTELADEGPRLVAELAVSADEFEPPRDAPFALSADGATLLFDTPESVERVEVAGGAVRARSRVAQGGWDAIELLPDARSALWMRGHLLERVRLADGVVLARRSCPHGTWERIEVECKGRVALALASTGVLFALDPETLVQAWQSFGAGAFELHPQSSIALVSSGWQRWEGRELATGTRLWTRDLDDPRADEIGPAGSGERLFLAPYRTESLLRFDARSGEALGELRPHEGEATSAGMLSGSTAWIVTRDGRIRTFASRSGETIAEGRLAAPPLSAASRGDLLVVCTRAGRAEVFEGARLEARGCFAAGDSVELARDGRFALTYGAALDALAVHALPGGELVRAIELGDEPPRAVAWNGTDAVLAACGKEGGLRVWRDGLPTLLLKQPNACTMAVDPSGRWLAVGNESTSGEVPEVRIFDATEGSGLARLPLDDLLVFGGAVRRMAFDEQGAYLVVATGEDGALVAWRCSDWRRAWSRGLGGPSELDLDLRGSRVWAWDRIGGFCGALDLATGRPWLELSKRGFTDLAPAPDGSAVAALRGGTLALLEPEGNARFELVDLGALGTVTSRADGSVRGDPRALRHVFVRQERELVRAGRIALSSPR